MDKKKNFFSKLGERLLILIVFIVFLIIGHYADRIFDFLTSRDWQNALASVSALFPEKEESYTPTYSSLAEKAPEADGNFLIHFIDVGQGDSILLQSLQPGQSPENILIDAGEERTAQKVIDYLKAQGVDRLNSIVATHPHSDHIGGLPKIFQAFEVKNFYMPKKTYNTEAFQRLVTVVQKEGLQAHAAHAGMTIPLSGASLEILAPVSGESYLELHDYSVVIRLQVQGKSFLLTGDAESVSETEQLESGCALQADVLKVANHGSGYACSYAYLQAVAPQYAIISVGEQNEYNLPAAATLERLQNMGCHILRTDVDGSIVINVKNGEMKVLTENKE